MDTGKDGMDLKTKSYNGIVDPYSREEKEMSDLTLKVLTILLIVANVIAWGAIAYIAFTGGIRV
jgi:hypothetical protein